MKGLIKGSNGSIQKQYGETYTEVQREGFSITRIFLCVLRDLRGDLNFLRSGGFQPFFPLADDRIFSVLSVSSVVKGEKCGVIS